MEITLINDIFGEDYTAGKIYIDGEYFCDTLEDKTRDLNKDGDLNDEGEGKVYGETAIPYGIYEMILSWSPKFKKEMPLIIGVKHFEGIRIHSGNTVKDTLGCILVGERNDQSSWLLKYGTSRNTFNRLMDTLKKSGQEIFTFEKK